MYSSTSKYATAVPQSKFDALIKSQTVRLGDVFIFGPILILASMQTKPLSGRFKFFLLSAGIGTIIYNLHNYVQEERRLDILAAHKGGQ